MLCHKEDKFYLTGMNVMPDDRNKILRFTFYGGCWCGPMKIAGLGGGSVQRKGGGW